MRALALGVVLAIVGLTAASAQAAPVNPAVASASSPGSPMATYMKLRGQPQVVLQSDVVDGHTWSVIDFANLPSGTTCASLKIPLPAGTLRQAPAVSTYEVSGGGCVPVSGLFSAGAIRQHHGWLNAGPAAGEWVWGYVSPRVKTLSVRLANCSTVGVPVAHGVFLYVADDASLSAGATPVTLIAKGSSGATIGSAALATPPAAIGQLSNLNGTPAATSASSTSSC